MGTINLVVKCTTQRIQIVWNNFNLNVLSLINAMVRLIFFSKSYFSHIKSWFCIIYYFHLSMIRVIFLWENLLQKKGSYFHSYRPGFTIFFSFYPIQRHYVGACVACIGNKADNHRYLWWIGLKNPDIERVMSK